jgi:HEAT repeat protein
MKLPSMCFGLLCLLLASTEAAAQEFPSDLLSSVPTAAAKLQSEDVNLRASILWDLVEPVPQSCTLEQRFTKELSKGTYFFVVATILEKDLDELAEKTSGESWGKLSFIVQTFGFREFNKAIAKHAGSKNWRTQAAAVGLLKRLDAREMDMEVANALSSSEKYVRDEALRTLIQFESKRAVPALTTLLYDPNENQRYYALISLAKVGGRSASAEIARLLEDEKPNIRHWAVDTLVKVNAKERAAGIWKLVDSGQAKHTEAYAVAALVYLGDARAIPVAAERIESFSEIGSAVLNQLVELKVTAIVPSLVRILDNPTPGRAVFGRSDIVQALGKLGSKEASGSLRRYISLYPMTRVSAIQVLGDFQDRDSVDDLLAVFYKYLPFPPSSISNETYDSAAAAVALAKIGDDRVWNALVDAAENPRYPYRSQIFQELNRHIDPRLWKKIHEFQVKGADFGSIKQNAELFSTESKISISLEYDPAVHFFRSETPGEYPSLRISPGHTLQAGLRGIVEMIDSGTLPNRFTYIFDKGTIRILPVEAAVKWWRVNLLTSKKVNVGT